MKVYLLTLMSFLFFMNFAHSFEECGEMAILYFNYDPRTDSISYQDILLTKKKFCYPNYKIRSPNFEISFFDNNNLEIFKRPTYLNFANYSDSFDIQSGEITRLSIDESEILSIYKFVDSNISSKIKKISIKRLKDNKILYFGGIK